MSATTHDSSGLPVTGRSPIPQLGEGFQESQSAEVDHSESSELEEGAPTDGAKPSKRRLFGFGRKKDDKTKGKKKADTERATKVADTAGASGQTRLVKQWTTPAPIQPTHPYQSQSPSRNLHSSSPRGVSPAGSQIFERDVQEYTLPGPNSPAIPAHIQTENHIPAVLDEASEAITDKTIDPDSVEIVTHAAHQPAALTVTGAGHGDAPGLWVDDFGTHHEDGAYNQNLDSTDVRRLSFISFADVVQSEHAEHSSMSHSAHIAGLTSLSSGHRSPSPIRSPVSSQGLGTSPPTSKSASVKGLDLSPGRSGKPLGSPGTSFGHTGSGELTIETMSQALKKMNSTDLGGHRSQPLSPISLEASTSGLPK
jgi:hypothetical protein